MSAGSDHTCAVIGAGLVCWGSNANAQLTDPSGSLLRIASAQIFAIGPSPQAPLTVTAVSTTLTVGGTTSLSSSGGSGVGAVTFASSNANCNISGITLTAAAVGGCTVTATKAADADYTAATATLNITVNIASQSITFGTAPLLAVGGTVTVSAGGGASGNPVTFTSNTSGVCTVSGVNGATVTGVTAGTCTIAANQAGNSNYNAAAQVTQSFSVTPATPSFTGIVYSRKVHGAAGEQNLPLDAGAQIGAAITVEPRVIGAGHRIVFVFDNPVTSVDSVSVVNANLAAVGTASALFTSSNELVVVLTGIPDNQRVTVRATGVNGIASASASIGFLVGDVNNTRTVNSSDISGVKARSGQATTSANFLFDVNASGAINSSDISAVKARSGSVLLP